MHIDIAIVNYHSADQVADCLATLGPWDGGTIWLVDNSCDAEQAQALRDLGQENMSVHVLLATENLGFAQGCNLAFAHSKAEFVLLLNPDALISAQAVRQMAQAMRSTPLLGALSPTIFWNRQHSFVTPATMDQTPWAEGMRLASQAFTWVAKRQARQHLKKMRCITAAPTMQTVDFLSGAVLLLRRQAVLEAARGIPRTNANLVAAEQLLFDPRFFMFFEDSDLSLRLRWAGWSLGVLPGAHAVHEYRHKAFKAGLMQQSRHHYFALQFKRFYRLTGQLAWLDALAAKFDRGAGNPYLGKFSEASEFAQATAGDGVVAFSPSEYLVPAIFRPRGAACTPLNALEWALLEPGRYTAHLQSAQGRHYCVSWTLEKP